MIVGIAQVIAPVLLANRLWHAVETKVSSYLWVIINNEMVEVGVVVNQTQVAIIKVATGEIYPAIMPFHPDANYPEYEFFRLSTERNAAYQAVRECFHLAGLDASQYGTQDWNPLGELISPGETVLLKPNLVKENHPRNPEGWKYVLTHGSVIRAVADYVFKALKGEGKVIVADAPQTDSSFEVISQLLGLRELHAFYRSQGANFDLVDLRKEEWVNHDGVITERKTLAGDPHGYVAFDLGKNSEFIDHPGEGRFYGADYDADEVNRHHSNGRHEYLIAGTVVHADVIFSLPKLKTHKKAGVIVTLKNLVGINGDKNWLPHHTEGDPGTGGDERPSLGSKGQAERSIVPYFRWVSLHVPGVGPWLHRIARTVGSRYFGDTEDVIRSGNWWGNNTTWRMCLDLNKIALCIPLRFFLFFLYNWIWVGAWRAGWVGYIWARLRSDVMRLREYKHFEIQIRGQLPHLRLHGPGTPDQRVHQYE